jgi:predicted small secreted protein
MAKTRIRTTIGVAGAFAVVVLTSTLLSACGRNWCIGGVGPCDMFKGMARKPSDPNGPGILDPNNPCGWNSVGNPRNGLTLQVLRAPNPLYVGQDVELFAVGGNPPYGTFAKNNVGTFTPIDGMGTPTGPRTWRFRASVPGLACVKVYDRDMTADALCDSCWVPLLVLPGTGTGGTTGGGGVTPTNRMGGAGRGTPLAPGFAPNDERYDAGSDGSYGQPATPPQNGPPSDGPPATPTGAVPPTATDIVLNPPIDDNAPAPPPPPDYSR